MHEKWLNFVFIVKNLPDRITISLRFFLEKRAIFRDFHCKYQRQARPTKSTLLRLQNYNNIISYKFAIIWHFYLVLFFYLFMPKQKLKNWLPTPEKLRENRMISLFAPFLADPRLWHLNRNALTRAVYVGVLCAFFPLPGQMPLALIGALIFRANVPMSIALTWITNPLTTIPIFWVCYLVGAILLGEPVIGIRGMGLMISDLTLWATGNGSNPFKINAIFSFKAFAWGLLVCGMMTSVILGIAFRIFWQYRIANDWQKRQGYNATAPKFRTQKGHKAREQAKNIDSDDFSI